MYMFLCVVLLLIPSLVRKTTCTASVVSATPSSSSPLGDQWLNGSMGEEMPRRFLLDCITSLETQLGKMPTDWQKCKLNAVTL
jgi:hypothetical protein